MIVIIYAQKKKPLKETQTFSPNVKNTKGNKTNGSRTENNKRKTQIVSSGAKRDTTVKETRELDATGNVDEQGDIVTNCFLILFF